MRTLWRSARTLSPTKNALICEQNLYAGHLYLLVHHARAASSQQPAAVLKRLEQVVLRNQRIVISANTCSEMRFGGTGPNASPRHIQLVDAFCARLDAILPWDRAAVDASTDVKVALRLIGTPIGPNDTLIAGHAIAAGAILVTHNVREFARVQDLVLEDWVNQMRKD